MLIGVVSDTHNNAVNTENIISLFNKNEVDLVLHTGDITNKTTLQRFSKLNCALRGVFGNNDRGESGLLEVSSKYNFDFKEPPYTFSVMEKNIAMFHEPDGIEEFLKRNKDIDIVLHGHTHRYREEIIEGTVVFNPGESAGILKGKNALGIIDLTNMTFKRIFF